jgi:hypothetical protein
MSFVYNQSIFIYTSMSHTHPHRTLEEAKNHLHEINRQDAEWIAHEIISRRMREQNINDNLVSA